MSTSLFGPTHICGLYYLVRSDEWNTKKHFVPQVKLEAKATILATTSKTVLTQTFANPSTEKAIKECRYTFPLYDGVSVVRFTCHVGGRKIVGEVKEREKARAVFQDAVSKGETAGLFEQLPDASDVFTTTVGNIPPGAKVIITITYLGELKHDMEVDGIRFTIPNIICPRYGDYPGTLCRSSATDAMSRSISITVDVDMADGSFIQKIQSPTHPISVSMGTTSTAVNADPAMTKASATLALATAELDKDFVLQVIAKHTGVPKAILETNPRIPNHRAVMATLVPKFALPPARPEIVFVCDRSGSMQLTRIELAKQALKVFLKSLPVGVKFNICSFGSSYSFLWEKSASYNQQTLEEAMNHVGSFAANYGGTEMLQPLQATIERRYKDMDLDIMLLTDGEDWGQDRIFSCLNEAIQATKAPIRVFTLGVGNGVSHALIEGIAKAGNGFSQSVGENEPMNTKVVRMLKGALSPHINDYTLEVKYNNDEISAHLDVEPEDDFEIVEKVSDSLKIKLDLKEDDKAESKSTNKTPISLFDLNADPDAEEPLSDDSTGQSRYAHLPTLPVPNIIQAPQTIPSLYPFHRTSLYLLLGPSAPQGTPISLTLRGTSPQGPLELTIPIQPLAQPGEAIHQLAAKKAIAELEQGRGWLAEATDASGALVKKTCEGRYDDMVEREAVRLGVQFQVGGKWCSFVAVESNKEEAEKQRRQAEGWQWMDDKVDTVPQGQGQKQQSLFRGMPSAPSLQGNPIFFGGGGPIYQGMSLPALGQSGPPMGAISFGSNTSSVTAFGGSNSMGGGGLFGSANALGGAGFQASSSFGAPSSTGGGLFGGSPFGAPPKAPQIGSSLFSAPGLNHSGPVGAVPPPPPPGHSSIFGTRSPSSSGSALFGAPAPAPAQSQPNSGTSLFGAPAPPATGSTSLRDYQSSLMLLEQQNKKRLVMARQENGSGTAGATSDPQLPSSLSGESLLHHLISLQSFEGSWSLTPGLLGVLGLDEAGVRAKMEGEGADEKVVATAIVIALFEERLEGLRGSWELVGEKGRAWLEGEVGGDEVEGWVERGKKVLRDD